MWPIVGHKRITQFLESQIRKNTPSQSYLFLGPASLGKFTTALFFAQTLLCLSKNEKFCQKCPSCQSFSKNIHSDLIIIENKESPISIETIRDLKRKIVLLPSLSERKIIIFEEASYLTLEAQNALLKTLEEPPKYATIILVAQKENLLPTILSRCTRLYFQPVSFKEIKEELLRKGVKEQEASFLAHLAFGQIGRVLKDPLYLKKWEENLAALLSLPPASLKEKMELAKNLEPENLSFWVSIFRDLLFYKINPLFLSNYPPSELEKISALSSNFKIRQLSFLLKKIQETQTFFNTPVNQRLLLENLILWL